MGDIVNNHSTLPAQAIPARIIIGVTGHRDLDNQPALADAIREAISSIKELVPPMKNTPLLLCVLSPLAEGADRLVAREILNNTEAILEVVLPLEKDDYITDFKTEKSKKEFETLLSQAKSVRTLPPRKNRAEAYKQVGLDIVDQCDVLIALWDGKPAAGKGGTQEIVQYARDNNCPLIWINPENPSRLEIETGRGIEPRPFQHLDEYNSKSVANSKFETRLNNNVSFFISQTENAELPPDKLKPTIEYMAHHYARADTLAQGYQNIYYRAETLVYVLALVAVMIAAFQILFIPERPIILISEIVFMLAVLAIVWQGRRQRWHEKWIDYRFLAERFRSALFMAITNINVAILKPPRHLSLAYSPKDWMVIAFLSVWSQRPHPPALGIQYFKEIIQFLCNAWIEDQIQYHKRTWERHHSRHRHLTTVSYTLFGLTIGVALLHVAKVGPHWLETCFAFLAVVFPAIAASITAIRTHRDYLRNSMRSAEMVQHLNELKSKTVHVEDYGAFLELVREAEATMLHENEDWRVVVGFHKIEPV